MLGTWRWNVGLGILGMVLTVSFSFGSNPLSVVLLRSVYAFIAFFVLAYITRAVMAIILRPPAIANVHTEQVEQQDGIGEQLNMTTPDSSEDLNAMLKTQLQGREKSLNAGVSANETTAFRPLNPPQLVSTKNNEPEEMAKAIRQLTGE